MREELELVGRGHAFAAGLIVGHARLLHSNLEVRNLVVDLFLKVLVPFS